MTTQNSPLSDILAPMLTLFSYPGSWGADSRCGLRLLTLYGHPTVILSELPDNPGTSVTNRAETIATQLLTDRLAGKEPTVFSWIEHYPPGRGVSPLESFDWLEFDYDRAGRSFTKAHWRRLTALEVEDLRAALIQEAH